MSEVVGMLLTHKTCAMLIVTCRQLTDLVIHCLSSIRCRQEGNHLMHQHEWHCTA